MEREERGFICAISAGATSYFNDLYFLIGLACLPDNISQESELTAEAELFSCHMSASAGERDGYIFFPYGGYSLKSDPSLIHYSELQGALLNPDLGPDL